MAQVFEVPTLEELMWLDDAGLERALVDLERVYRVVYSGLVDVLDVADVRRVWQADGHRGVWNWSIALTGISPAEASRRCQLMRALRDLDELRERLRAGEVGVCQAREVTRVHANRNVRARLVRAEELMVGAARRRCFTAFHEAVDRWSAAADRVTAERTHDDVHAQRRARFRVTPTGFGLSVHGGSVQGAQMHEVFAAFVDAEFRAEWDAGRRVHGDDMSADLLERTGSQREFDALHAIFVAACRRPADGGDSAVSVPTVNIVVDERTAAEYVAYAAGGPPPEPADPGDMTRRCETDRGVRVDPREAVAAMLVGRLRRVVYDSAGVVIDLGRSRRLFTGSVRRAVWLQGRTCLWPGCTAPAHEQDHLDEWGRHHGHTCAGNAGPMCGRHNRWKQRGYRTWRQPDGTWHVERPDTTPLRQPRAP